MKTEVENKSWKGTGSEEVKEPFCGACVAGLTALVGVGSAGGSTKIHDKKKKKIVFWISIGVTLLSIFILVYFLWIKKCGECR